MTDMSKAFDTIGPATVLKMIAEIFEPTVKSLI